MHRPRLVILDEPTAGVDFELRTELWEYIRRLHAEGTTILLTTHYLEEAEQLCEEIAPIRRVEAIARDSAHGLREHFAVDRLQDVYVGTCPRDLFGLALPARFGGMSKLWTQTVLAPVIASILFILVFGSLGGRIDQVSGVDYEVFIVPGLITMGMVQAAYANNSSSIFQARFDPLRRARAHAQLADELGYLVGGFFRSLMIGGSLLVLAALLVGSPGGAAVRAGRGSRLRPAPVRLARRDRRHLRRGLGLHHLHQQHRDPAAGVRGRRLLLGGRCPLLEELSHLNPVFYLVNAVRFGFLGESDVSFGLFTGCDRRTGDPGLPSSSTCSAAASA